MANIGENMLSGTGRLVAGDPFFMTDEGYQGAKLKKKDGSPREEMFLAVAFPKDQPAATKWDEMWALITGTAALHKDAANHARLNWANFSFKYHDGDAPENASKPGYAGCHVLHFKNGYLPQVFDENRNLIPSPFDVTPKGDGTNTYALTRQRNLQKGHYVRVMFGVDNNDSAGNTAGIFLNCYMVQRVGYGEVIQSGPDYSTMLNQEAVPQLAGMSAMPVGGTAPALPSVPGVQPPPAAPGMTPPPAAPGMPGLPPSAPAAPGVPGLPPSAPAAPGTPPAPPAAPSAPPAPPAVLTPQQRMIDPNQSYDSYITAGWTEQQMIDNGVLRPAGHAYNA